MTVNFLFVGSAFLGVDRSVVAPLATYADHYGLQVVHLGPLATDDEVKMWRSRDNKLRTWENAVAQFADSTTLTPAEVENMVEEAYLFLSERGIRQTDLVDWDDYAEDELAASDVKYLKLKLQMRINLSRVKTELDALWKAQEDRILALQHWFPNIKFVFADDNVVNPEAVKASLQQLYLGTKLEAGKIDAVSMLANGPKVAHAPITARTVAALASSGRSTVLAHPIPMSDSRAKEGLNNARNYFTTGCLYAPESAVSTRDIYKGKHLPGGVVCVMDEDGSFFANNLIVDKGSNYFVAEDGLMFTANGVTGVDGKNCAVALTDSHAPHQHMGVVNASTTASKALKAQTFIHLGDMADFESVNRHANGYPGRVEGKRLEADLQSMRSLMSKIVDESGAKSFVLIDSNHHEWVTDFVEKHPALKNMLDWPTLAKTWFPDWELILRGPGDNKIFRFGNLTLRHGDQETIHAATEMFGPTMNGHWHRYYRLGQAGILACSCRLGPAYVGNNITAWQSQFATLTVVQGKTQSSYHTVLHNEETKTSRYCFRNTIIKVLYE